jgi:hypothetical protein
MQALTLSLLLKNQNEEVRGEKKAQPIVEHN